MFAARTRIALTAVVVAAFSLVARAEQIDNPAYKGWAQFKAGTAVKTKMVTEAAGNKTEMATTTTLADLSPEKATVEAKTSMVVAGNKMDLPAQKQEIPAKIEGSASASPSGEKPAVKESEESVTISGKAYPCKVIESTSKSAAGVTTSKVWTCSEVPGGMVKMTSSTEGATKMNTTMELVEVTTK